MYEISCVSLRLPGWNTSVPNSVAGLVPYGGLVRGGQKSKGKCMEIERGFCTRDNANFTTGIVGVFRERKVSVLGYLQPGSYILE